MKSAESTEVLGAALCGAYEALSGQRIDAVVVGGIALSYYLKGDAKIDHDVDLFIREGDVDDAMAVLTDAGFEVVRTHLAGSSRRASAVPWWTFSTGWDG